MDRLKTSLGRAIFFGEDNFLARAFLGGVAYGGSAAVGSTVGAIGSGLVTGGPEGLLLGPALSALLAGRNVLRYALQTGDRRMFNRLSGLRSESLECLIPGEDVCLFGKKVDFKESHEKRPGKVVFYFLGSPSEDYLAEVRRAESAWYMGRTRPEDQVPVDVVLPDDVVFSDSLAWGSTRIIQRVKDSSFVCRLTERPEYDLGVESLRNLPEGTPVVLSDGVACDDYGFFARSSEPNVFSVDCALSLKDVYGECDGLSEGFEELRKAKRRVKLADVKSGQVKVRALAPV